MNNYTLLVALSGGTFQQTVIQAESNGDAIVRVMNRDYVSDRGLFDPDKVISVTVTEVKEVSY